MHVTCLFGHIKAHLEFGDNRFHTTAGVWDLKRPKSLQAARKPLHSSVPAAVLGLCRAEVKSSWHTIPMEGGGVVVAALGHK